MGRTCHINKCIGDLYVMQKRAELMGVRCAILKWFADSTLFSNTMLEKAGLPENYDRMSPHDFMAWVHSTFPGKGICNRVLAVRIGSDFQRCNSGSRRK